MNKKIAVRVCKEYDPEKVLELVSEIYKTTGGPDVKGKKVLVKPNILSDEDPSRCISTHPVVVEAVIKFLQSEGATVFVGDSPAVHPRKFRGEKSGIFAVCQSTGAEWVDFTIDPAEKRVNKRMLKIASVVDRVDLIISLPKFKNHELMYFTGAVKNSLGLVPGFSKAKQHALWRDRKSFGEFLVDLNETVTPDFFLMDGIMGMEGPGPGNGYPVKVGILLGSTNPVALDIVASQVAGYEPMMIPTTMSAVMRKRWVSSETDIIYDGPDISSLVVSGFRKIPISGIQNIVVQFVLKRVPVLRKLERRPVFIHDKCTGCLKCVKICPTNAIQSHNTKKNYIVLTDRKCIRCFCCSEVCGDEAIEIRRKVFGA